MKRKIICSLLTLSLFTIPAQAVETQTINNYTANNQTFNNVTNNITNNVVNNQIYNYMTNNTVNNITNNMTNNYPMNGNDFIKPSNPNEQNVTAELSIGTLKLFDNAQTAINRFIRNYQDQHDNVIYFSDADSQLAYGNWLLAVEKDENNLIKRISYSQYGNPTTSTGITLGKTISIGNNKADLMNAYGMWNDEMTNYDVNVLIYNNLRYGNIPVILQVFVNTNTQLIYGYEILL